MSEETDQADKSEDPSEHRIKQAREKGDVAKSQELNSWFMLTAATFILLFLGGPLSSFLKGRLSIYLARPHDYVIGGGEMISLYQAFLWILGGALFLPFLILVITAITANLVQVGFLFTLEPIKPKFSKISPLAGLKRLFSSQSLVNFAKSLGKLFLVSFLIFLIMWPQRDRLDTMVQLDPSMILLEVQDMGLKILAGVCCLFFFIALGDYAWTRFKWFSKMKMSVKELKEELKQQDGDPEIKARIRQIRMQRSRSRMMAGVKDASLVVTNPVHFAVALKYETGMNAPVCVAKGQDYLALRIKDLAKEHDIPVIENPPLARALFPTVEVEEEIPEKHFKAVAEIIGYLSRQRRIKL